MSESLNGQEALLLAQDILQFLEKRAPPGESKFQADALALALIAYVGPERAQYLLGVPR